WSAPYITLAVDNGLISGYPDSTFRPNNTVLLEEAVTICLKLLGYTEADYGKVWPSGPMSLARSLELLERIEKSTGDALSRRDVMYLIYNTVNTKVKGTQTELIGGLNYTFLEDTVLIATQSEDASVAKNKIVTSTGTYKIGEGIDLSLVGRRGDAFIKNGDTLVSFIPVKQTFENHAVYSVLNQDIIVYQGGQTAELDIDTDLPCYSGSKTETVMSCLSRLETGDVIKLAFDDEGDIDYVIHFNNMLKGPYTVTGDAWMAKNGISNDASVIKNGKTVLSSDISKSDIVYYSEALNLVWAYDDKVSGTYQSASPNQENPASVMIAGNTYAIESTTAFNKLSSNGSSKLGDTITVLLGRNGGIADVITDGADSVQYGYLVETGKKEFPTSTGKTETSNYAKVITADGTELELKTIQDYKETKNQIVSVKINNGVASLTRILNKNKEVSGKFDADNMKLDDALLSQNINILDLVSYNDPSGASSYTNIFPKRLDGAELSASDIIHVTYNEKGEIDNMFLNDVTGDGYKYGIVSDMQKMGIGVTSSASYTLNLAGNTASYNRATVLGLDEGHPVAAQMSGNSVSKLKKLSRLQKDIQRVENSLAYGK
ncbi:MAG: S-layer homology domain-containing protein, partial [Clostridia bacterium]|nr:S-layer homology domain-containing protein [Clostridia bacterium]